MCSTAQNLTGFLSIHSCDKRNRDVVSISKIRVVLPTFKQQVCCAVRRRIIKRRLDLLTMCFIGSVYWSESTDILLAPQLEGSNVFMMTQKCFLLFLDVTRVLISPEPDPGMKQATATKTYNTIPRRMAYKQQEYSTSTWVLISP